jgi:hypothetical protein
MMLPSKITLDTWIKPDYVTRRFNASSAELDLAVGQKGNGFVAYPNIDRENPL